MKKATPKKSATKVKPMVKPQKKAPKKSYAVRKPTSTAGVRG